MFIKRMFLCRDIWESSYFRMIELVNLFSHPTTGLFERNTLGNFFIGDYPISCFGGNSIFCDRFINLRSFRFFYGIILFHTIVFSTVQRYIIILTHFKSFSEYFKERSIGVFFIIPSEYYISRAKIVIFAAHIHPV